MQTLKAELEVLNMMENIKIDHYEGKQIGQQYMSRGGKLEEAYVIKKLHRVRRLKAQEERVRGHIDTEKKRLLLMQQEWLKNLRNKVKMKQAPPIRTTCLMEPPFAYQN